MEIKQKACNPANYGGALADVRYIVVHWTSNEGDTAKNNVDYFAREVVKASAHYFVDENEVWNSVPPDRQAWHVGAQSYVHPTCRNSNSIGVEMCLTGKSYVLRRGTIERAVTLVRELMARYDVPLDRVLMHHDVTGKYCPGPFVDNPGLWDDFKTALAAEQEEEMRYKYYDDMPDWAKPTISKLVKQGYLQGEGDGVLNLSEDALKIFVVNDRAGLYG